MKSNARTWYRKKFFKPKVRGVGLFKCHRLESVLHTSVSLLQIKLLTEAEYMEQSRLETERQLEGLRRFCASPKCDAWKVASRLQSPTRFAEFVQGELGADRLGRILPLKCVTSG